MDGGRLESMGLLNPGRLQSMGLLRVGHDWSDLAVAADITQVIKMGV